MFRSGYFFIIILALILALAGCAGNEPLPFKRRDVRIPENGVFYFYLPADASLAEASWKVTVDGHVLGNVSPGEFLSTEWKEDDYTVLTMLGDRLFETEVTLGQREEIFVTLETGDGEPRMVLPPKNAALPVLEGLVRARFDWSGFGNVLKQRDGDVIVVREPKVARRPILPSDVQSKLRGEDNCHVAYLVAFTIDTSGFPQEVRVTNSQQFTAEQIEFMIDYFEDYRFHTYREDGKRVSHEASKVMLFHGPYEKCPTLPRGYAVTDEMREDGKQRGLSCPSLDDIDNQWRADELWSAMRECLDVGDMERTFILRRIAGAYTDYDVRRVADPTAHHLAQRMFRDTGRDLDRRLARKYNELMKEWIDSGSEMDAATCDLLETIGPPAYHPDYMIKTGADHFFGVPGDGLVEDFNEEQAWTNVVDHLQHCSEAAGKSN